MSTEEAPLRSWEPCAAWTDDCQGKKDYDGRLLDISTRYWPGGKQYGERPSASASILLRIGPPDSYGYGAARTWREAQFECDTETEVKVMVEAWVKRQMADVVELLGGVLAFSKLD